jgi:AcrR family transcriptional regulator
MGQSATVRPPSPHVHAKHERRRAQILRAALQAFRERGYHATTLDHIAKHLGVRKTALYHYFPDKDAILFECHRDANAQLERIVAAARRLSTPDARLRHLITEHVRVMTDTLQGSPLAFEVPALAGARQAEIIAGRDAYERELRRTIDQGVRARALRKVDSKVTVFAILGAINWIARWYRPEGALQAGELGAQFADHLVGGLVPPARRRSPVRSRSARPARSTRARPAARAIGKSST